MVNTIEFPIYQFVVAVLSHCFSVSLDATGRVVSYLFFIFSVGSVYSITKKLSLPFVVFIIFVAIVFSMPIYIYWGRGFMIETAALFFSLMSIVYFWITFRVGVL
jgi:4-amino-4-deoxy-L-arabinose transferase-like glycosyltransferase